MFLIPRRRCGPRTDRFRFIVKAMRGSHACTQSAYILLMTGSIWGIHVTNSLWRGGARAMVLYCFLLACRSGLTVWWTGASRGRYGSSELGLVTPLRFIIPDVLSFSFGCWHLIIESRRDKSKIHYILSSCWLVNLLLALNNRGRLARPRRDGVLVYFRRGVSTNADFGMAGEPLNSFLPVICSLVCSIKSLSYLLSSIAI